MLILNYILTAYRSILQNRFFSALNIVGLTIGILSAIFVLLYVTEELAYDKHHTKHSRIYRVVSNFQINAKQDLFALTAIPLGPTLKEEFPEIEEFVRFVPTDNFFFRYNGTDYNEEDFFFADSTVFTVFDHHFISGEPTSALNAPNSVVLTKTLAAQLFGSSNPIGEVIVGLNNKPILVTAVIDDLPRTSHFRYRALISMATLREEVGGERFNDITSGSFWNVNTYTYLLIKQGIDPQSIADRFANFSEKYIQPVGNVINGTFMPIFQPIAETHFPKLNGLQADFPVGNRSNVFIFSIVALFILLVACINYMNMASARSTKRAKEVGIRKVVGAGKGKLMQQFLSESLLMAIIAGAIALVLSALLLNWFNTIADKEISLIDLFKPQILMGISAVVLLVGLAAGSYPAFYLSSFVPVKVLKGSLAGTKGRVGVRRLLVVLQFAISVTMIIATIVVSQQQRYIRTKDIGFDKSNLLVITDLDTTVSQHFNSFKQELLRNPLVIGAAGSQQPLGLGNSKIVCRVEQEGEMKDIGINLIGCDFDYLSLMGLKLNKGRFFDPTLLTDSTKAFVVNSAAEKAYGWTPDAIGKRVQFGIRLDGTVNRDGAVVGVVNDFHYSSVHNPIEPFMFFVSAAPPGVLTVRYKEGHASDVTAHVKRIFDEYKSTREMKYFILEQQLEGMYRAEQKLGILFRVFSFVTILISCLGLLGLTSFVTEQRTKEIGVRKVMGGTNLDIIVLISKQFLVLVLVATLFAWPAAYFAMSKWLQGFWYRISFGESIFSLATLAPFAVATTIAIVVAAVTVGWHSWRAAERNPANSLKYE